MMLQIAVIFRDFPLGSCGFDQVYSVDRSNNL